MTLSPEFATLEAIMQRSWSLRGSYANWTMTITVGAPDHLDEPDVHVFPVASFVNLGGNFRDAVNLFECRRAQDDRADAGSYGSRVY